MTIPTRTELRIPFLEALSDGQWHSHAEIADLFAAQFGVTDAERAEMLPNKQHRFDNHVHGARADFARWRLLEYDQARDYEFFRLSELGRRVRDAHPTDINAQVVRAILGDDFTCL